MSDISVIIPVYNTGAYLQKCLNSVLNQSLCPLEVILVNDGSTDNSGEICEQYARQYPALVRVISQKNQGAAAARNAGLSMANGSVISFVDSDDYIEPGMYETLMQLMEQENADFVSCEMLVETPLGATYQRVQATDLKICWDTRQALIQLCSYRYLYVSFCNTLVLKKAFQDLRFPEGDRCEDYSLLYQIIASCRKVAYVSKPFYHYVQRDNSASRTKEISLRPMEISMEELAFFEENFPDIVWAAKTDCAFSHMGIYTTFVRNGVMCPLDLRKRLQKVCKAFLRDVMKNEYLLPIKKLQASVFCYCPGVYKMIITRKAHR